MQIARVIGTVVSTVKNESLHSRKFLIVQTLDTDLKERGKPMVALDAVGAGVGELVFWCRGKEAAFPFKRDETPTDCTIVGIIDSDAHVFQENNRKKAQETQE
jgi:microcompartment protein CcmK/EutM